MPVPYKNKKGDYIANVLLFIITSVIVFACANLVFNYLWLFKERTDLLKSGADTPADWYDFKTEYLLSSKHFPVFTSASLSFICGILFTWRVSENRKRAKQNKDVKGDARWETRKESIADSALKTINMKKLSEAEYAGVPLCRWGNTYLVDTSTTHTLGIGCTRSGKSQAIVMYMLYFMGNTKDKQNICVNDPKGELLEASYKFLKAAGYDIHILNLRDTSISNRYNPLTKIIEGYKRAQLTEDKDLSDVGADLNALTGAITFDKDAEAMWTESAKSLLNAMIYYLLEACYITGTLDKLSMYTVKSFFTEFGQTITDETGNQKNRLDELFKALPAGHLAKIAYATSNFSTGDTRSSIFATLSHNLDLWADEGIDRMTSGDDINFNNIIESNKPQAIFMVIPDDRKDRHKLASLFIDQLYQSMIDHLGVTRKGKMERRWNFILDEFANMIRIPDMDKKMTVSAGRNILFHLFIQSFGQLDDVYGESSKAIRESCGNLVYVYSMSKETNDYISDVLSKSTIEYRTYSGTLSESMKNSSQQLDAKSLMSPDELRLLKPGELIVIRQRHRPIFARFTFFYKLAHRSVSIYDVSGEPKHGKLSDLLPDFELLITRQEQHLSDVAAELEQEKKQKETSKPLSVDDVFYLYEHKKASRKPVQKKQEKPDEEKSEEQASDSSLQQSSHAERSNISPLKASISVANELSGGEFSEYLLAGDYVSIKKLINRLSIRNAEFKQQHADRLREYIEARKSAN